MFQCRNYFSVCNTHGHFWTIIIQLHFNLFLNIAILPLTKSFPKNFANCKVAKSWTGNICACAVAGLLFSELSLAGTSIYLCCCRVVSSKCVVCQLVLERIRCCVLKRNNLPLLWAAYFLRGTSKRKTIGVPCQVWCLRFPRKYHCSTYQECSGSPTRLFGIATQFSLTVSSVFMFCFCLIAHFWAKAG